MAFNLLAQAEATSIASSFDPGLETLRLRFNINSSILSPAP